MAGVVLGAIIVNVLLEVLREPGDARYVFYVAVLARARRGATPLGQLAVVLGGTVALGLVARRRWRHLRLCDRRRARTGVGSADARRALGLHPDAPLGAGQPIAYVTLVAALLTLTLLDGWRRIAALVPTIYLAALSSGRT